MVEKTSKLSLNCMKYQCKRFKTGLVVTVFDDYGGVFETSRAADLLRLSEHISEVRCEKNALRGEDLINALQKCDVALLTQQRTTLDGNILEQCPDLQWILNTGRNSEHLNLRALQDKGMHAWNFIY